MTNSSGYIALDEAKNLIVSALTDFDEDIGSRAQEILDDPARHNIVEATTPKTNMMACRPAGITEADLKSMDMYLPDFAEEYGPNFTTQENPNDFAVIDFEYHGTPESVVYLAHELGHAVADDIQRENGFSFKDFSVYDMEQQAYFIQNIVSEAVGEKYSVNNSELNEDPLKMSFDRASAFVTAGQVVDACRECPPHVRSSKVTSFLGLGAR